MPANLTPEYLKADKWFRSASTDDERLLALKEMLRTIPKHKGTEHMRADLKRRLSKLKETLESGKRSSSKRLDIFHVPSSGAGQVVLIGTPNCGKSSIAEALSNAKVNVADYPFSTAGPVPGMIKYEDVSIQLVDMPPVTADHVAPGQVNTYRSCDLIGIVIDISGNVCQQMQVCLDFLEAHRLLAGEQINPVDGSGNQLGKKALVVCSKSDIAEPSAMGKLKGVCKRNFEFVKISSQTGNGLEELTLRIYKLLDIVRVYSKKPGKKPDMKDPFTLPRGSTVFDLARSIHRELADKLKSAKAWGTSVHDGQKVHRTHELADKDIIELHFS